MIKSDLGAVTAYADAVKHGYTGTREDFGKLLANAGLNLEAAAAAKVAAEAAAGNASTAAQTATNAAGIASQAASAAANSADAASTSAGAAAQSAEAADTAQQGAENAAKKAAEAKTGADNALKDAGTAKEAASNYADAAADSATAAATSETNAANSASAAAGSAEAAAQTKAEVGTLGDEKKQALQEEGTAQQAAIKKKGQDTLATIPENYTQTVQDVSQLKEEKLNKPALPVVGELLRVKSVSDAGEVEVETEDISELQKRQNVLVGSESGNPVSCDDAFAAPLFGLHIYGKSTQDGTPTPDAPVPIVSAGDGGNVVVKVTGKNLLNPALFQNKKYQNFNSGAGFYEITENDSFWITGLQPCSPNTTYYLNTNTEGGCFYDSKKKPIGVVGFEFSFKTPAKCTYFCVNFASNSVNFESHQIIASFDRDPTYEPYHDEQLLTLQTPTGLPGVPVTSGGNYTDPTGQQWVCDEVDLERGVKVQRVNKTDLSSCLITGVTEFTTTKRLSLRLPLVGTNYNIAAICNRLPYKVSFVEDSVHFYVDGNNTLVFIPVGTNNPEEGEYILFYVLATPIETPLTPAEIAAYKALTAYAPNTVVQASDGAGIKLDYQRDVNLVVKNLEDAIASMTTT